MPNLIVIMFNLMYPVFYVGFLCKGRVWERVWNSRQSEEQRSFRSVSWVRLSCEIPAKHFVLPICHIWYTRSLHTLYIPILPTLPTYWNSAFQRENPNHNLWESEIIIPTILYTIHCGFSQLLPLHFQILDMLIA